MSEEKFALNRTNISFLYKFEFTGAPLKLLGHGSNSKHFLGWQHFFWRRWNAHRPVTNVIYDPSLMGNFHSKKISDKYLSEKNFLERNVFFLTFLKIPFLQINGNLRIKQMLQTISFWQIYVSVILLSALWTVRYLIVCSIMAA